MSPEPYWRTGAPERRTLVRTSRLAFASDRRRLRVGLVNNMPDSALAATERQFRTLVEAAAPERTVELKLFHIREIERGAEAAARLCARSRPVGEARRAGLDALIVTGAEPRAADLQSEPFWPALTRLADWTVAAGVPSLWSCLAAHAAVLHLDSVHRHPLPEKCSGLFACAPVGDDAFLSGLNAPWMTPHSRNNALAEAELVAAGYDILSRSAEAGVDAFIRRGRGATALFLQGHPEYEPNSLALEFKRDLQRYLTGARETPPSLPCGVFAADTQGRLSRLAEAARRDRRPELMAGWPLSSELTLTPEVWRTPATRLLRNWLESACEDEVGVGERLSA